MKFNGTIFSKPQQDQLKEKIGGELEKVTAKVDEVDARMLNYTGDWATDNEYHEKDIVTWEEDGQLYEVIKAHTSSNTLKPGNTEYYKAMTVGGVKYTTEVKQSDLENFFSAIDRKSVVDIKMTVSGTGIGETSAMLMGTRTTSLIAFVENITPDSGGNVVVKFSIVVVHIIDNFTFAKQYDFDANGNITTQKPTITKSFTVTFIK